MDVWIWDLSLLDFGVGTLYTIRFLGFSNSHIRRLHSCRPYILALNSTEAPRVDEADNAPLCMLG